MEKVYTFGEKTSEKGKMGTYLPVSQTPKYREAKAKAIEMLNSKEYGGVVTEGDFWILKNETKAGDKILYSGLIISHNGCLKINDTLPEDKRFDPSCVICERDGWGGSLVFHYRCESQGIYEVGEVNAKNCKNAYPYAIALKRLIDRVILKNCKLAYAGIYSDSEAEEFAAPENETNEKDAPVFTVATPKGAFPPPEEAPPAPEITTAEKRDAVKAIFSDEKLAFFLKKHKCGSFDEVPDVVIAELYEKGKAAGRL